MVQYKDLNSVIEVESDIETSVSSKSKKSRGNFLRNAYLALLMAGIIFSGSYNRVEAQTTIKNDINPFINFLENNDFLSAKDYVLSKFEKYDIVILSERFHQEVRYGNLTKIENRKTKY